MIYAIFEFQNNKYDKGYLVKGGSDKYNFHIKKPTSKVIEVDIDIKEEDFYKYPLKLVDDKIVVDYDQITKQELLEAKDKKTKEIKEKYISSQIVKIINGVVFYVPIRGEFFNTTILQILKSGELSNDKMCYIRIEDLNKEIYVANLPASFLGNVYSILNSFSQKNNNNKEYYKYLLEKADTIEKIESLDIVYQTHTLDLNQLISDFIKNPSVGDRDAAKYLKNTCKDIFDANAYNYFDIFKPISFQE